VQNTLQVRGGMRQYTISPRRDAVVKGKSTGHGETSMAIKRWLNNRTVDTRGGQCEGELGVQSETEEKVETLQKGIGVVTKRGDAENFKCEG